MSAVAAVAPPRTGSGFTGLGVVTRFVLRRDRVRLAVWVGGIVLLVVTTAASYARRYPTAADRTAVADAFRLPATVALVGPYRGGDVPTYGALVAQAALGLATVLAALMSIFTVVRATRAEEESGRAELITAAPVGRHVPLTAALVVAVGADFALGVLIALGLPATGVESITSSGSLLFGAAVAATGVVFAAVAAVTAQVSQYGRGAAGLAGAVLGAAYALRAIGDVGPGGLSWLSPIGWAQAAAPFTGDHAAPLLLAVVTAAGLIGLGVRLRQGRDLGSGLIPPAPGPAYASAGLGRPLGLAWRLQRVGVLAWALAITGFSVAYGSILGGAEDLLREISTLHELEITGARITDSFAAALVLVFAIVVAAFTVQTLLKTHSEEAAGRAEVVLATAVPRSAYMGSHLAVAMVGGAGLLLVAGTGLGLGAAVSLHDAVMLPRVAGAALAYVPAVWVVAGFAALVVGRLPRWSQLAWAGVAYPFVAYYATTYLGAPRWVEALSPYAHVPLLPAEGFTVAPLFVLVAVAAGLVGLGLTGFRRRDLVPG